MTLLFFEGASMSYYSGYHFLSFITINRDFQNEVRIIAEIRHFSMQRRSNHELSVHQFRF